MTDTTNKYLPLPKPAFKLFWDGGQGCYKVTKSNIDKADVFTAEQIHAYVDAHLAAQAPPTDTTNPAREIWELLRSVRKVLKQALYFVPSGADENQDAVNLIDKITHALESFPSAQSAEHMAAWGKCLQQCEPLAEALAAQEFLCSKQKQALHVLHN